MEKKCRKCREIQDTQNFHIDRLGKYGVASTCKRCKSTTKKQAQKTRGHSFSDEVRVSILERDRNACINKFCPSDKSIKLHAHHVYWKTFERIHDFEKANTVDKGVSLCFYCHMDLHAGDTRLDKYCHQYLFQRYSTLLQKED